MSKKPILAALLAALALAYGCGRSDLFSEGGIAARSLVVSPDTRSTAPASQSAGARRVAYRPPAPERLPESPAAAGAEMPPPQDADRMLVRTVELEIRVDDTEAVAAEVADLAVSLGGYVGASDARRSSGLLAYEMVLRVPAAQLDDAVNRIKAYAETVDREQLTALDVTDQIIDADARLVTLRATEVELQGLLAESREREHGLEDIMAVYGSLTEIRSDIERLEGRLANLEGSVALSTIDLEVRPSAAAFPVVDETWSALEHARGTFGVLVDSLQGIAGFLIFVVIVVMPVSLIIGIPLFGAARLLETLRARTVGRT